VQSVPILAPVHAFRAFLCLRSCNAKPNPHVVTASYSSSRGRATLPAVRIALASLSFRRSFPLPAIPGALSHPCWMNRAFYARLRHHSLTCFSQPVAYPRSASLATSPAFPSPNIVSLELKHNSSTFSSIKAPSSNPRRVSRTFLDQLHTSTMNGTNGTVRAKRKQHPSSVTERPQKQHRAINGKESAGQNTPEVTSMYDEEEVEIEDTRILPGMADTAEWQACIENVVRNVVSIRFCQTCSFDTDPALTSEATGFVVDAERGYVLFGLQSFSH
jgi:hypothetical protein